MGKRPVKGVLNLSSYKKAAELCLARCEKMNSIGPDSFTKKLDPYLDILLNQNLPRPVIDQPVLADDGEENRFELSETAGKRERKGEPGNRPSHGVPGRSQTSQTMT